MIMILNMFFFFYFKTKHFCFSFINSMKSHYYCSGGHLENGNFKILCLEGFAQYIMQ